MKNTAAPGGKIFRYRGVKTLLITLLTLAFAIAGHAATTNTLTAAAATATPVKTANWLQRHDDFLAIAKKGSINLLFLGDSITDGWRSKGKYVWDKNYTPLKAANFGICGDRTQNVLWRLQNGELDGIKPKLAVLMIGTNNLGNKEADIVAGIQAIIAEMHKQSPQTKLLLLGIFPRGLKPDSPQRIKIKSINTTLAKLDDDGKSIKYLDIGDKFIEADGTLPTSIMPDGLHPNGKGYEIWAKAITPTVQQMLQAQ